MPVRRQDVEAIVIFTGKALPNNSRPRVDMPSDGSLGSSRGFHKAQRLLRQVDFARVLKSGRRRFTAHFVIYVCPSQTGLSRLGLTVSRKVGPAPLRNRIKRCLREAFRLRTPWNDRPVDIVVIAKATHDIESRRRLMRLSAIEVAAELYSVLGGGQAAAKRTLAQQTPSDAAGAPIAAMGSGVQEFAAPGRGSENLPENLQE